MSRLTVSSSPHIRTPDSTAKIMWTVSAALAPALVAGGYFFGWRAFWITLLAVAAAVGSEALALAIRRQPIRLTDGSAVVTGILVAFCMPATVHWYVPVAGSAAAILVAKQAFGGLGSNIWNPALVGRAVVHNSFPADMNPSAYRVVRSAVGDGAGLWDHVREFLGHFTADVGTTPFAGQGVDAVTGASPLSVLKRNLAGMHPAQAGETTLAQKFSLAFQNTAPSADDNLNAAEGLLDQVSLWDAFVGNIGGNIGEVSALLLLVGAAVLVARGIVRWYVPAVYVGVVAVLAGLLPLPLGEAGAWVWAPSWSAGTEFGLRYTAYHVLCGGLMLGALYMATDMVTSPLTPKGLVIFAAGCGLLTVLIRLYGGYPEGVCYSILLMNTVVPLIDRWTKPRVFGRVDKKASAQAV